VGHDMGQDNEMWSLEYAKIVDKIKEHIHVYLFEIWLGLTP